MDAGVILTGGGLTLVEEGGKFAAGNMASAVTGGMPFAWDSYSTPPTGTHIIPHLNDLKYGNSYSWLGRANSPTLNEGFIGISFDGSRVVDSVALGRDNTNAYTDRWQGLYTLQYTTVVSPDKDTPDASWTTIGTLDYQSAGGTNFTNPVLRHRYDFTPVTATGMRLIVPEVYNDVPNGDDAGTCIDEIELYSSLPTSKYEAGNNDASFTFASIPGPMADDLGEKATISMVQGSKYSASGDVDVLVDGTGGDSGTATDQSFFVGNGQAVGKILMSWDDAKWIREVRTFVWQDYTNDQRYPQVYELFGSLADNPGTGDADLAGGDWTLLAEIDSTDIFGYDGGSSEIHPEQTAVSITGPGGVPLGTASHLLWRITLPDGGDQHAFYREFDVFAVPEPAGLTLIVLGSLLTVPMFRRRR